MLCLASWLAACSDPPPKVAASEVVKNFYQALVDSKVQTALQAYDERFFANKSKQEWQNYLQELGHLKKFDLNTKQADTRFSGKFYIYQFYTQYDKGKAREVMTLFLPNGSDTIRIVGHKINFVPVSSNISKAGE